MDREKITVRLNMKIVFLSAFPRISEQCSRLLNKPSAQIK
jgi:hypothetical protein